jgi:hypothetical protein
MLAAQIIESISLLLLVHFLSLHTPASALSILLLLEVAVVVVAMVAPVELGVIAVASWEKHLELDRLLNLL